VVRIDCGVVVVALALAGRLVARIALAVQRPGWTAPGWYGRLIYLAAWCEQASLEHAERYRRAASLMTRSDPSAKYFQNPG